MAETLEQRAARVLLLRAHGFRDRRILNAFEHVPRALFINPAYSAQIGHDCPLPLACGQTIEKPTLAARLIEALAPEPDQSVIEVGTGSGWMTAILAVMSAKVVSFERYRSLHGAALTAMRQLGLANVSLIHGDGLGLGLTEFERADRVFLNCALTQEPVQLIRRLKTGAHLVCAVGQSEKSQMLKRFIKKPSGFDQSDLGAVRLLPAEAGLPICL